MIELKFCKECKYSRPEPRSEWNLRCHNPSVNSVDPWSLSSVIIYGSDARTERSRAWYTFPSCGMSGRRWSKKEESALDPKS